MENRFVPLLPETIENYDFAETDCTATTSIVPQILGGQQYFTAGKCFGGWD